MTERGAGWTVRFGTNVPVAQTLAFGLVDFAKRISGGEADFAAGLASTPATGPQTWHKTAGDYEAAVDEAIAVCAGHVRQR